MSAMKRTTTLFDFNFGKVRDRGMIKTKYRDNMRTTKDARKNCYFLVEISITCENVMSVMSEGLTSAASESTMRLMSGSVTENGELRTERN